MRREGIVGSVMQAEIGCLDRSADFEDDRRREAARDAALAARGKESMLPDAMRQLHERRISEEPIEAERMSPMYLSAGGGQSWEAPKLSVPPSGRSSQQQVGR